MTLNTALLELRSVLTPVSDPLVVYGCASSGGEIVASLLQEAGIMMGVSLNEQMDSLPLLPILRRWLEKSFDRGEMVWHADAEWDRDLIELLRSGFTEHLGSPAPDASQAWGWKLNETAHMLPLVAALFPQVRCIHVIRDVREVAFLPMRAPHDPYWRRIIHNTPLIEQWGELEMSKENYEKKMHLHNALHWQNTVMTGRLQGGMLTGRYLEVRWEDLCENPAESVDTIMGFAQTTSSDALRVKARDLALHALEHRGGHVTPPRRIEEVIALTKPLLLSLGYLGEE